MRYVEKPDIDKTDKLKNQTTIDALNLIVSSRNKDLISDSIYRDPYEDNDEIRSKVENQLAKSYLNKCAYCERLEKADIEHYRPKKSVKSEVHDGYYWLCYEWTNLLPSCVKCNRDGAKLTHFPILGTRVIAPTMQTPNQIDLDKNKANNSPLIDEKPMLLHPEIDKPESYFEFELDKTGEGVRLKGLDPDGRGEKTIEICKLNRQELRLNRQRDVIDPFIEAVQASLSKREENKITDLELIEEIEVELKALHRHSLIEKKTHTLLRNYIIKERDNFERIILPYFSAKVRNIVLEGFKNVFEKNLQSLS
jgi:uncharacterized protein (TIGR02646 family)